MGHTPAPWRTFALSSTATSTSRLARTRGPRRCRVEPSAAPFHDWNERITAECYRPNGWARVLDDHGRVAAIVDNYEHLSLQRRPDAAVVARAPTTPTVVRPHRRRPTATGRRRHRPGVQPRHPPAGERARRAHAGALGPRRLRPPLRPAGRGHVAARDRGQRRRAARSWPRRACASRSWRPGQAAAVRPLDGDWRQTTAGGTSTRHDRAPACRTAGGTPPAARSASTSSSTTGRSPTTSRSASPGSRARTLVARVIEAGGRRHAGRRSPPTARRSATTTSTPTGRSPTRFAQRGAGPRRAGCSTLAELAGRGPAHPRGEVHVSAWSCAHGVGRWHEDCGCSTGGEPGWNQAWRAPLRAALDLLRDHGVEVFERRGAERASTTRGRPATPTSTCSSALGRDRAVRRRPRARRAATGWTRRSGRGPHPARGPAPGAAHVHVVRLVLQRPRRPRDGAGPPVRGPRLDLLAELGEDRRRSTSSSTVLAEARATDRTRATGATSGAATSTRPRRRRPGRRPPRAARPARAARPVPRTLAGYERRP